MDTLLIIIAIVLFVSVLGLLIDIRAIYDIGANEGNLIVKLFKIPVFNLKLRVEGNILNFSNKRKKKPLQFAINKKNLQTVKLLKKNIVNKIYISDLAVDCVIVLDNPAMACIISSSVISSLNFLKLKIINTWPSANVTTNVLTGFEGTRVVAMLDLCITLSIIDLIWAIAKTIFDRRRLNGAERRNVDK